MNPEIEYYQQSSSSSSTSVDSYSRSLPRTVTFFRSQGIALSTHVLNPSEYHHTANKRVPVGNVETHGFGLTIQENEPLFYFSDDEKRQLFSELNGAPFYSPDGFDLNSRLVFAGSSVRKWSPSQDSKYGYDSKGVGICVSTHFDIPPASYLIASAPTQSAGFCDGSGEVLKRILPIITPLVVATGGLSDVESRFLVDYTRYEWILDEYIRNIRLVQTTSSSFVVTPIGESFRRLLGSLEDSELDMVCSASIRHQEIPWKDFIQTIRRRDTAQWRAYAGIIGDAGLKTRFLWRFAWYILCRFVLSSECETTIAEYNDNIERVTLGFPDILAIPSQLAIDKYQTELFSLSQQGSIQSASHSVANAPSVAKLQIPGKNDADRLLTDYVCYLLWNFFNFNDHSDNDNMGDFEQDLPGDNDVDRIASNASEGIGLVQPPISSSSGFASAASAVSAASAAAPIGTSQVAEEDDADENDESFNRVLEQGNKQFEERIKATNSYRRTMNYYLKRLQNTCTNKMDHKTVCTVFATYTFFHECLIDCAKSSVPSSILRVSAFASRIASHLLDALRLWTNTSVVSSIFNETRDKLRSSMILFVWNGIAGRIIGRALTLTTTPRNKACQYQIGRHYPVSSLCQMYHVCSDENNERDNMNE